MTKMTRKLLLCLLSFFLYTSLSAQLEVAHIFSKGESATGFGAFLHFGFPVATTAEVGIEGGVYFFAPNSDHLIMAPFLLTYRHTFEKTGTGFYLEPVAGYTAGTTDIPKTDASGNNQYDASGNVIDQKLSGPTAGLGLGYLIPSARCPLNICLRYEHLFVPSTDGPSPNLLALRLSWSLTLGRRLAGK
jgi:hypothetical protein